MKSARIGIVVGITVVGLAFAIWLIESLPGIPYNLQELVADRNPVIQAVLLSGTLYALFGIPAVIARLAQLSSRAILILPLLLVAETAVLWLFLRSAVPAESIHDILGTPILDWPWEWEYLFRLSGLVIGSGIMLAGSCLLTTALLRTERRDQYRTLLSWAVLSVLLLALAHWIIVEQAATDNLTELMASGGKLAGYAVYCHVDVHRRTGRCADFCQVCNGPAVNPVCDSARATVVPGCVWLSVAGP